MTTHTITSREDLMRPDSVLDNAEPGDTLVFTNADLMTLAAYAARRMCHGKALTFILRADEIESLDTLFLDEITYQAPNVTPRVEANTIGTVTL